MNKLWNLVKDKSVIIVGPSPHLKGEKLGSFIDSFDIVVRINEFFVESQKEDYGSKTNIAFLNLASASIDYYKAIVNKYKDKIDTIDLIVCPMRTDQVLPYNDRNLNDENIFSNYEKIGIKNNFYHIGDEYNRSITSRLSHDPTSGIITLISLLESPAKKVFLTGYSFYLTETNWNDETNNLLVGIGRPKIFLSGIGHPIINEVKEMKKLSNNYEKLEVDQFIQKNILNSSIFFIKLKLLIKKIKYKVKDKIKNNE